MKQLIYETKGEKAYELLRLEYDSQIIYEGYTDDFITSVSGELELRLNYGGESTSPVIAKKFGETILWVPRKPIKENYRYSPIIFSLSQFTALWEYLRYNPQEDLDIIHDAIYEDIKLMWLMPGRGPGRFKDILQLVNSVKENTITFSIELDHYQKVYYQLLEGQWSNIFKKELIMKSERNLESVIVYLDKGNQEWEALKVSADDKVYIHLGKGICLPLE